MSLNAVIFDLAHKERVNSAAISGKSLLPLPFKLEIGEVGGIKCFTLTHPGLPALRLTAYELTAIAKHISRSAPRPGNCVFETAFDGIGVKIVRGRGHRIEALAQSTNLTHIEAGAVSEALLSAASLAKGH